MEVLPSFGVLRVPHDSGYRERVLQDGFAVVEGVLDAAQVAILRDAIAAIPDGEEVRRRRGIYGVRNLLEVCPEVRQLSAADCIRDLVTPVLGDHCFAVRAIYFDKVLQANWKLGWHQDSVISVRERVETAGFVGWSKKAGVLQVQPPPEVLAEMLAIRVHLDDSHADNGPLRVLPGSHRYGWLDAEIDHWKATVSEVPCYVRMGGVVAMRPLLLHASSAATIPTHRRVIHIEFAHQELPGGLEWNQRIL